MSQTAHFETANKLPYGKPGCEFIRVMLEGSFCTSVKPDAQNSTEPEWEEEITLDGGTIDFY